MKYLASMSCLSCYYKFCEARDRVNSKYTVVRPNRISISSSFMTSEKINKIHESVCRAYQFCFNCFHVLSRKQSYDAELRKTRIYQVTDFILQKKKEIIQQGIWLYVRELKFDILNVSRWGMYITPLLPRRRTHPGRRGWKVFKNQGSGVFVPQQDS